MMIKLVSLLRLILGPVALYLIITKDTELLWVALAVMVCSTLLGFVNVGLLVKQKSKLAQVVHTVSDSIFHISVFIAFLVSGWISIWVVLIIYSRDIITPYVQSFAVQKGIYVPDQLMTSRVKSIVHGLVQIGIVAVVLEIIPAFVVGYDSIALFAGVAVVLSVVSFVHYLTAISGKQPETNSAS